MENKSHGRFRRAEEICSKAWSALPFCTLTFWAWFVYQK